METFIIQSCEVESMPMRNAIRTSLSTLKSQGLVNFRESQLETITSEILSSLSEVPSREPRVVQTSGSALEIDPYSVVASMARAANIIDERNESQMQRRNIPDDSLDEDTRRIGWGIQKVFGVFALRDENNGRWRVVGTPQAIDSWFVLYQTLLVDVAERVEGMSKREREKFYQALTRFIREHSQVQSMISQNASAFEEAKAISREWISGATQVKYRRVPDEIREQARIASQEVNPFRNS